jgi:hypothetical protein
MAHAFVLARALHPGVGVKITIFCDLRQFSAKNLAFFSKANVMIKVLHNFDLFWCENTYKYLNTYNIGLW